MEKKVYDLKTSDALAHIIPPLQETEVSLLTTSLLAEGCRDPLVVWNGVVVDGNNRYRICHENNIPFTYVEMEFESEEQVKLWVIRNQLGRRNVPDFVKCELVLSLEPELKAEAKMRQIRKTSNSVPPNLAEQKRSDSRDELAKIAGVAHGTIDMAKKIIKEADEETKEKLRSGEIKTYKAYKSLKEKENSSPKRTDLLPGYGLVKALPPMKNGAYVCPPDDVYDIPPIEVYGNMPSDDMALRGNAEIIHAKSDMTDCMNYCVRKVSEILRAMTEASVNEDNIDALKEILTNGYQNSISLLNKKLNGGN